MKTFHPCILHIIGKKKSGKTSLLEYIIRELINRGYRVGAFKHSVHTHPLDKAGSDSDRLRLAGANPSVFATPEGLALFCQPDTSVHPEDLLEAAFSGCHIVLVESSRHAKGPKIFIQTDEDDAAAVAEITAVVNASGHHPNYPAFQPGDSRLIDYIIRTFIQSSAGIANGK